MIALFPLTVHFLSDFHMMESAAGVGGGMSATLKLSNCLSSHSFNREAGRANRITEQLQRFPRSSSGPMGTASWCPRSA